MKIKHEDLQVNGFTFFMPGLTVMKVQNGEILPEEYLVINFSVDNSLFNNTLTIDQFRRNYLDDYKGETRIQLINKEAFYSMPLKSNPSDKCVESVKNLIYVESDYVELERFRLIDFSNGDHKLTNTDVKAEILASTSRKGAFSAYLKSPEVKEAILSNQKVVQELEFIDFEKAGKFVELIKSRR